MKIYSVHTRRGGLDPDRDIVLVKEGFCWPAALLAPVWALWRGLWIQAAVIAVAYFGIGVVAATYHVGEDATFFLMAGLAVLIGYLANDFRRSKLDRNGFVLADIVAAPNREAAAYRFFDRHPVMAAEIVDVVEGGS